MNKKNTISGWLNREIAKPIYRGLLSIPDFGFLIGNLTRAGLGKKPWKYPSQYTDDIIDWSTDGHSKGEPSSIAGKAIEFGVGMGSGGGFGNLARTGAKVLKTMSPQSKVASKGSSALKGVAPWLGSTKKSDIATGAIMGGATQYAEDEGYSPLATAGIGLGVGMLPSVAKGVVGMTLAKSRYINNIVKDRYYTTKARDLDLKAYEAAQRLNIDLPSVAFNKSGNKGLTHWLVKGSNKSNQLYEKKYKRGVSSIYKAGNKAFDNLHVMANPSRDFDPHIMVDRYLIVEQESKILRQSSAFLNAVGGERNKKCLDDIVKAMQHLPRKNTNTGLHRNMQILLALAGGVALKAFPDSLKGTLAAATSAGAVYWGAEKIAFTLMKKDSRILKKTAEYARKSTQENAKKLNNAYKEEFGKNIKEMNKELERVVSLIGVASKEYLKKSDYEQE